MFSLSSTLARRSARTMLVARRPLTAQSLAQVQDLESVLTSLHWKSSKDTVEEIRQMMDEYKTNHAIRVPEQLEDQVCSRMGNIKTQISTNPAADRNTIDTEIFGLKRMVKSELYRQ